MNEYINSAFLKALADCEGRNLNLVENARFFICRYLFHVQESESK